MPMLNVKALVWLFAGAHAFCTLHMVHGFWQMPLSSEGQPLFTIVTFDRLYTPRWMQQGVLNAIPYFQGVMKSMLIGFKITCLVWIYDVALWRQTAEQLIGRLELVLVGLEERGVFVAAQNAGFYRDGIDAENLSRRPYAL